MLIRSRTGVKKIVQEAALKNKVTASAIHYRRITADDLVGAHKLSLAVRWPHRLQDWEFNLRLGTGYVAEDQSGIIGTAMCWSHGAKFASLGMVIVSPDHQGQGIGRILMTLTSEEVSGRTILLNSTPSGQLLYDKLGFLPIGAIHQHQGTVFTSPLIPVNSGERIRPIGARDINKLAELSGASSGMPRHTMLSALTEVAEGIVIDRYDEIIGFAMLRRFGHGYAIGPVIASTVEHAKALISHWAGAYAGSFMRIDVTGLSELGPWLNELGLVQVDTVISMALGDPPLADKNIHRYAIISQALG
jgi:GNAT superfamily N-acetyltransferase